MAHAYNFYPKVYGLIAKNKLATFFMVEPKNINEMCELNCKIDSIPWLKAAFSG
jgi:hypothetical protein